MSMNLDRPPDWHADRSEPEPSAGTGPARAKGVWGGIGEFLLCRLLRKIVEKGTLRVLLPSGRSVAIGTGLPLVKVQIRTSATVWRLLRNPDLALGEAYMEGSLLIGQGGPYELLDLSKATPPASAIHIRLTSRVNILD